jgi:flagellar biosynthesis/type III secretory pathway protein FliH
MEETPQERRRTLLGVLYAEDFDTDGLFATPPKPAAEAPPPEPPEPEIVEPVYTAAELESARDEGRAAGRAETEHGLAATRTHMMGLIATGMDDARSAAAQVAEAVAAEVARTLLTALAACLPALCAQHGATELRALARAVLPVLVDEPRITVRVNPSMAAAMMTEIAALDSEIAERIVLLPTEQLEPGDGRVSWQEGSAVRDAGRARAAVEDALAALGLLDKEMIDA